MLRCPNCGAPLKGNVCEYCNCKVELPEEIQKQEENQQTKVIHYDESELHQNEYEPTQSGSSRSRIIAFILCLMFGCFGVHHLYCGKIGMAILYFFTGGLFGIGWFIDIFLILLGFYKDKEGNILV